MRKLIALTVLCFIWFFGTAKTEDNEVLVIKTEPIPKAVKIVEAPKAPEYRIEVTEDDIDLMARVVMSEASILDMDGKVAVACTMVNRVMSDKFPNTVSGVVNQKNAYSTADNGEPTKACYKAVFTALEYESFPDDLFYFRTDYPHSFGHWYFTCGNTYFSTEEEHE